MVKTNFGNRILGVIIPRILKTIIVLSQIAFTMIIGLSVVYRFMNKDLYGNEEFVLIFAFWLYMMGGAYGSFERSHIQADIVKELVANEKIKRVLTLIASIVQLVTCLVITYWSWNYFVWGITMRARSIAWKIPMVIPQSAILVGFFLMSIYSVIDFSQETKKFFVKKQENI